MNNELLNGKAVELLCPYCKTWHKIEPSNMLKDYAKDSMLCVKCSGKRVAIYFTQDECHYFIPGLKTKGNVLISQISKSEIKGYLSISICKSISLKVDDGKEHIENNKSRRLPRRAHRASKSANSKEQIRLYEEKIRILKNENLSPYCSIQKRKVNQEIIVDLQMEIDKLRKKK